MEIDDNLKAFAVKDFVDFPDLEGYEVGFSSYNSSGGYGVQFFLLDGGERIPLSSTFPVPLEETDNSLFINTTQALRNAYNELPHPNSMTFEDFMNSGGKPLATNMAHKIKEVGKRSWSYILSLWEDSDHPKFKLRAVTARKLREKYHFVTPKDSKHLYRYKDGFYRSDGEEFIKKLLETKIGGLDSNSGIKGIVSRIERLSFVERSEMKPPKHLILCENGILNWKEEEMEKPKPDYFFTNKIPVKYNPEVECPRFKSFLKTLGLNPLQRRTIFAGIGLSLIPDYPIKAWFLFYGEGDNGKTTLLNLIGDFLGEENVAHQPAQDICSEKWATSRLVGKLANIKGDLRGDELKKTSKLKQLTGGDKGIKAQRKYEPEFTFNNYAVLWFSANQIPKTKKDKTRGFYLRTVPIKFPVHFVNKPNPDDPMEKEKILDIEDKILTEEEKSGILNEAIKELKWTLENTQLPFHRDWRTKKEIWEAHSDKYYAFIRDKLRVGGNWIVKLDELHNLFTKWAEDNNFSGEQKSTFAKALNRYIPIEKKTPKIGGKQINCRIGIRYKEDKDLRKYWVGLLSENSVLKNLRVEQVHRWTEKGEPLPQETVEKGGLL